MVWGACDHRAATRSAIDAVGPVLEDPRAMRDRAARGARRAAGGGAPATSSWAMPRRPAGVSGAATGRAAMDARFTLPGRRAERATAGGAP